MKKKVRRIRLFTVPEFIYKGKSVKYRILKSIGSGSPDRYDGFIEIGGKCLYRFGCELPISNIKQLIIWYEDNLDFIIQDLVDNNRSQVYERKVMLKFIKMKGKYP